MYRGYYQVKEMAAALVDVAKGVTYTEVARRVQADYWGVAGSGRLSPLSVEGGQAIADWLNLFGPTISANYAEDHWPETVVLDATEFQSHGSQLFVILAAWGYEAGSSRGRLWRVEARPYDQAPDWVEFLRALPGVPKSVVYDGERAIGSAIRQRWSGRIPGHICEYHLHKNAMAALDEDEAAGFTMNYSLLDEAFHGLAEWVAFKNEAQQNGCAATVQWAAYWDRVLTTQVARRSTLPAHYSTGPLDRAIATIRQVTEKRKWSFRNRERMNQMLDLVRLRINRRDNVEQWAELIRQELEANNGQRAKTRQLRDPKMYYIASRRLASSLRA
jgi:hypothetical protein